jgi:Family of unknown function (DUF6325)
MAMGPAQLVIIGFDQAEHFTGEGLAELQRLSDQEIVRLVDLVLVRKHDDGRIEVVEAHTPGEAMQKLLGLDGNGDEPEPSPADDEVWYVADAIPPGTAAAIALIEHRWAIGLRDAVQRNGGGMLAEAWVHPLDLQAVGLDD